MADIYEHDSLEEDSPEDDEPAPGETLHAELYLENVDFPATRIDLLDEAREAGAPDWLLEALDAIPDEEYGTPEDVTRELEFVRQGG